LPDYPIPEGFTIDTYFEHLSKEGLEERLELLYPVENVMKTGLRFVNPTMNVSNMKLILF
jgi:hypothetical protein